MSSLDRYPYLELSSDKKVFKFISTGPNGDIKKIIEYQETTNRKLFNLAFGDLNPDGSIDDLTISDNKDRNKILATVAGTIFDFTQQYPEYYVGFSGSTMERTRLYRMAISIHLEFLSPILEIWGLDEQYIGEPFQHGKNYYAFLIRRK